MNTQQSRTLLLHIGLPKTGTTAIQTMYATHPQLLADAGYVAPPFSPFPAWNPEEPLYGKNGKQLMEVVGNGSVERVVAYLENLFSHGSKVFLSDETWGVLSPRMLTIFDNALTRCGIHLSVLAVVRNLYRYFYAFWAELVRGGYPFSFYDAVVNRRCLSLYSGEEREREGERENFPPPFEAFIQQGGEQKKVVMQKGYSVYIEPFHILEQLSAFTSLQNISVLHYDAIKNDVCKAFSKAVGTAYIPPATRRNKSLSYRRIETVRHFVNNIHARNKLNILERSELASLLFGILAASSEGPADTRMPYVPEAATALRERYQKQLDAMNAAYGIRLEIISSDEKFLDASEADIPDTSGNIHYLFERYLDARRNPALQKITIPPFAARSDPSSFRHAGKAEPSRAS